MSYLKAALGVALIMFVWLVIELTWRRTFGRSDNPRLSGCSGCTGCTNACESNDKQRGTGPTAQPGHQHQHGQPT